MIQLNYVLYAQIPHATFQLNSYAVLLFNVDDTINMDDTIELMHCMHKFSMPLSNWIHILCFYLQVARIGGQKSV